MSFEYIKKSLEIATELYKISIEKELSCNSLESDIVESSIKLIMMKIDYLSKINQYEEKKLKLFNELIENNTIPANMSNFEKENIKMYNSIKRNIQIINGFILEFEEELKEFQEGKKLLFSQV